ncbi:hypothetical protein [Falsiroseomonas sp. E2-1-a4]|uniref:hypothetical protein n=1 Tax=Falsiroseomonas sp. E2-1-a4 TaxID=3239299 RepID=UPI003F37DBC1
MSPPRAKRIFNSDRPNVVEFLGWPDTLHIETLLDETIRADFVFEAFEHAGKDLWLTRHNYRKENGERVQPDEWPLIETVSNILPPKCKDLPESIKAMFQQEGMKGKKLPPPWKIAEPLAGVQRGHAKTERIRATALQDRRDNARLLRENGRQAPSLTRIGERQRPNDFELMAPFVDMDEHLKFYPPQQRLSGREMPTRQYNDDAIASMQDWKFHKTIDRVNAVTFRLDKRPPAEVISIKGGFQPPVTRKDPGYDDKIAKEFVAYMKSRHNTEIDKEKILQMIAQYKDEKRQHAEEIVKAKDDFFKLFNALKKIKTEAYLEFNRKKPYEDRERLDIVEKRAEMDAADEARTQITNKQDVKFKFFKEATKRRLVLAGKSKAEAELVADRIARREAYYSIDFISSRDFELLDVYLTWMSSLDKEASHLGRMVENQFRKGWISTAYCLDKSFYYALQEPDPMGHWIYVVLVPSGFVVPYAEELDMITWGTPETEVAHFGELHWDRVVGFAHLLDGRIDSPIFFQKRFREKEEAAFEAMHLALSGHLPGQKLLK